VQRSSAEEEGRLMGAELLMMMGSRWKEMEVSFTH